MEQVATVAQPKRLTPQQARQRCKEGKKIACGLCGRNKFSQPQPHRCNSGNIRKRGIVWLEA